MQLAPSKPLTILFRVLFILCFGTIIFLLVYGLTKGYDNVCAVMTRVAGTNVDVTQIFSENRFYNSIYFLIALNATTAFFTIRLWRLCNFAGAYIRYFFSTIGTKLSEAFKASAVSKTQWVLVGLLMVVTLCSRIFYLSYFPLTEDEAFSYINFVDKGFLITTSHYPGPNNHIFYNLVCGLFNLFTDDATIVMKVPVLITSVVLVLVIFLLIRKYFDFVISFAATSLFALSFNVTYFSVTGRGYLLLILLMILMFVAIIEIIRERDILFYNGVFVLSAAFGFYTVPTFLFPFASIVFFGLNFGFFRRGINIKWIFRNAWLALLFTAFLYLPVILVSGLSSVTSNPHVTIKHSFTEFVGGMPEYFTEVNDWLWTVEDFGLPISLAVFGIGIFSLFKVIKKSKIFWFWCIISQSLLPVVILLIYNVYPFNRVWLYFSFFQFLFLAVALYGLPQFVIKSKVASAVFVSIATIGFIVWSNYNLLKLGKEHFTLYEDIEKETTELIDSKERVGTDISTVYVMMKLKKIDMKILPENDPEDCNLLIHSGVGTPDGFEELRTYKTFTVYQKK